jgi:hypothetical protein
MFDFIGKLNVGKYIEKIILPIAKITFKSLIKAKQNPIPTYFVINELVMNYHSEILKS